MEETNKISFLLPEQFGVSFILEGDEYTIFPLEGRLSDAFLDAVLAEKGTDKEYSFYDSEERENRLTLVFEGKKLLITHNGFMKYYSISHAEFRRQFAEFVKKYAIYFAAPINYKAIMCKPFDEMVAQMKRYQPEADQIVTKIEKNL